VSHFIEIIAKTAARGGNLMINVGPKGDGTIDDADVAILRGIGQWMKVNGESIHGTARTPLPVQAWGESTRKGNTLYLHVFDWPSDGKLIVGGLRSNVKHACLLSDPRRTALQVHRRSDLDWSISVPLEAPDATDSVVALVCDGDVFCDDRRLLLANCPNALRVFDGQISGTTIRFGQGKRENAYVEEWCSADDAVRWPVRATETTHFEVAVTYDAAETSAGGTFDLSLNGHTLRGTVAAGRERTLSLGKVHLPAGSYTMTVTPAQMVGSELMRLRTVTLTPATSFLCDHDTLGE
jgi:hypothetical protein